MTKIQSISLYIDEEGMKMIEWAAKLVGLNKAAFCRQAALIRVQDLIKQFSKPQE